MSRYRPGLSRLIPAAALIAALGLPMTACAKTPVAQAPAAKAQKADAPVQAKAEKTQAKAETKTQTKAETKAEPAKPKTAAELAIEKQQAELEKLQAEAKLRAAKLAAELAPLQEKKAKIEAQIALLTAQQQQAQTQAKLEKDKADFEAKLKTAKLARELALTQQKFQKLQLETQIDSLQLQAETAKLAAMNAKLAATAATVQSELALIQAKRTSDAFDKTEMQYPDKPLQGKTLYISDRRIPLNGPIGGGTAKYVTDRIHYFNNLNDKAPIFIVIDGSPGGSVMEGYRIVTAMQNSKAPVHVVVKSYAASMAAVITTLAVESYTYPNALILHHQMSSGMRGNLTQQKEWLEEGMEWAKRLAVPVAKKMGTDYDGFVKRMYKNNSDGDWAEFGDKAVKLKWANHVITEIREKALVAAPIGMARGTVYAQAGKDADANKLPRPFTQHELFNSPIKFKTKTDGNGNSYTELPRLSPYDFYFLHDPKGQYQVAK